VLAQTGDNLIGQVFKALGKMAVGQADCHASVRCSAAAAAVVLLVLLALVALRLLSVVMALLQFHGFRLSESAGRLSVQRGLLSRIRGSVPRHRIQAFSLSEGVLHRWFGRRSLRVDTAVMESSNERSSFKDLAPLATPEAMDALIDRLLPDPAWPVTNWQPLHPRAWRRKFFMPALFVVVAIGPLYFFRGPVALLALALVPILYWRAVVWARNSAYSIDDELVAFRSGWLDRRWRFAEATASCRWSNCCNRRSIAGTAWPRCASTPPAPVRWKAG
jgi:putative membrane protein